MSEDKLHPGIAGTTKPWQILSLMSAVAGTVCAMLFFAVVFSGLLSSTVAVLLFPFMVAAGLSLCLGLVAGVVSLARHEGALALAALVISILGLAILLFDALVTAIVVLPFYNPG